MGAGHLNVGNALTNFQPGEYESGSVPLIGWDLGSLADDTTLGYAFNAALPNKVWVAATLVWDRIVTTTEVDNSYGPGTEFINNPIDAELANLNLYLVDSMGVVVASSTADADSVEHIFFRLGANQGGNYTLRVENAGGGSLESQDFGLAW
jgi:hypothetical protein